MDLKKHIRDIPDFPKKGILFHDVTTLVRNPEAFAFVIDEFKRKFSGRDIKYIVGIESRGFILGGALAYALNIGFIPIRKPGKLPAKVIAEEYSLEYGTDKVEIHEDAMEKGDKVVVIDDLIATGGTITAGINLVKKLGADIVGVATIVDMPDLGGSKRIAHHELIKLVEYEGD